MLKCLLYFRPRKSDHPSAGRIFSSCKSDLKSLHNTVRIDLEASDISDSRVSDHMKPSLQTKQQLTLQIRSHPCSCCSTNSHSHQNRSSDERNSPLTRRAHRPNTSTALQQQSLAAYRHQSQASSNHRADQSHGSY